MEPATLAISRFSSVYRCTPRGDAGQRVRDRLDGIVRRGIAGQVEAMLGTLARGDDRSVWVIRRLSCNCVVNAAWDDDRIAKAWARRLVYALALELAAGGSDDIIRFDSPAAQLARFIADVAEGDAYGKWYNGGFGGLKALPASIALRTALVEAGGDGAEALGLLSGEQLRAVLHTLSPADALLVLRGFARLGGSAPPPDMAQVAGAVLRHRSTFPVEDARWGLAAFAAAGEFPACARELVASVATVALHALRRKAAQAAGPALAVSTTVTWPEVLVGNDMLERMPAATRALLPDVSGQSAAPGHTDHGGGFLLLPVLLSMPIEDWVRGWPLADGTLADQIAPDRLLRALVLATCLGPGLLHDPLWCELLGLPADTGRARAGTALGGLGPKALTALRRGLAGHAREHGEAPLLHKTVRASRAWRIDYDPAGYWHRIAAVKAGHQRIVPDADIRYLAARLPLTLTPAWQRLLVLAAQQVLRRFARRLPGFALSHLDYLYTNFLCLPAAVEQRGNETIACLGRPPLALMLNLAGMTRATYALPWHPGRTCVLHVEGA